MDLNQRKEKKGQHVGCCGSRTDLSADTVELIERMDRLAEKQATASMSIVALPSSFQESNSSDRYRKYCAVMRTAHVHSCMLIHALPLLAPTPALMHYH
ncbi:hypothetical protein FOB22_003515 [Saccharomyces cerevisiae]|nr:hypothetical protein FOB22_003515 [Saccharomyces cerevisiae]